MELQRDYPKLREAGINLVTISYDSQEVLKRFTESFGIEFTMLADVGSKVIERFDLRNPVPEWGLAEGIDDDPALKTLFNTYVSVTRPNELFVGIAFPGTFMLDAEGVVRERHFEEFYVERNTVASVLLRRGQDLAPVEATRVQTPQLTLTAYASNPEVAVGNRFALVMEIEPLPGMHVYAPGAAKYRAVALVLEDNPHVRLLPMRYPASEDYYFEPFDETVPVYQEPIKLLQEVVLDGAPETQRALREMDALTLTGRLDYQACSDEICFPPQAIPLSFTLPLREVVFRRP